MLCRCMMIADAAADASSAEAQRVQSMREPGRASALTVHVSHAEVKLRGRMGEVS